MGNFTHKQASEAVRIKETSTKSRLISMSHVKKEILGGDKEPVKWFYSSAETPGGSDQSGADARGKLKASSQISSCNQDVKGNRIMKGCRDFSIGEF